MRRANVVAAVRTIREPGTYRTSTGVLVHCRVGTDGSLRIDIEDDRGREQGFLPDDAEMVKLSDDPFWPDR